MSIQSNHLTKAADLVGLLRRSNQEWLPAGAHVCPWWFRGEAVEIENLIPSAWRQSDPSHKGFRELVAYLSGQLSEASISEVMGRHPVTSRDNVVRAIATSIAEVGLVCSFVEWMDELGKPIPGDRVPRRISTNSCDFFDAAIDLRGNDAAAFALARHQGVATRLLDWTANPLYAAYFAASAVKDEDIKTGGNIIIWALNSEGLRNTQWDRVRVLRSHVGFLHAQEGVLIYARAGDLSCAINGNWPSLQTELRAEHLRRFTLPYSEVRELRRLLNAERVERPYLMPTFDVIKATLDDVIGRQLQQLKSEGPKDP